MNALERKSTVVCVHEDRPQCLVRVKLTVLSLLDKCPGFRIIVSCPSPPAPVVS